MSNGPSKRSDIDLATPRKSWSILLGGMQGAEFWLRVVLCAVAVALMWTMTGGWNPPFVYRVGYIPDRDICARVPFGFVNEPGTLLARDKARETVEAVYMHDDEPLEQLRGALDDKLAKIINAKQYSEIAEDWKEFFPDQPESEAVASQETFDEFRSAFTETVPNEDKLQKLKYAVERSLHPFRESGLLKKLEHGIEQGSQTEIMVFKKGIPEEGEKQVVEKIRIGDAEVKRVLRERLEESLKSESEAIENPEVLIERLFAWLRPRLASTLTFDKSATDDAREKAARDVKPVMVQYKKGDKLTSMVDLSHSAGIEGGNPLQQGELELLKSEHEAFLASRSIREVIGHVLADIGMYSAIFLLVGCYLSYREPNILQDRNQFMLMLGCITGTVIIAYWVSFYRTEIIPVVFFAMAVSIAYRYDTAWLLSSAVSMICAFTLGIGLTGFIILVSGATSASFLTGEIRSRTKLVYVGLITAAVVVPTVVGVSVLNEQPISFTWLDGLWYGLCSFLAALLMTALLPFVEKVFKVQTDLSLLELGDAAHPLLQELVRRAPGTYNHSINVASISEAAAETIGANGLLCRVSAYFHDIGKMRKPEYFVENQGSDSSKHDRLVPAMSTLVIIAHVKDGVELARQHNLPEEIIDFIRQHHGTTLVEYFYDQATKQQEGSEDEHVVDEATFRYPGPRPQSREACVMMLADAVESASRTLVDPAPSRIENLVHEIMLKRLHDRQFDECDITLKELNMIEESLVKSITATYHSRIKYPQKEEKQQPA